MIFVMFGAPASGKGTHSGKLSEALNIPCISTGDLLRAEEKKNSAIWQEANGYMSRGELVPDEVVLGLLKTRIAEPDCANGFILDGFPRTKAQKDALEAILATQGKQITGVIQLDVSREELIARYQQRVAEAIAAGKPPRSDDTQEAFVNRLEQYSQWTAPVLDEFRNSGTEIHTITANGAKEQTAAAVREAAELLGAVFRSPMNQLREQGALVSKDPDIHLL